MRDGIMVFPPNRQSRHSMPRNDFMFPNQGYRQMPARNNHITGFLQQFIGHNQNIGQMTSRGVEGIAKTLNGVQQVLRVVDTAAPIVKQYGPLVRNLPAMYRMMKAFKDMESTEQQEESNVLESITQDSLPSSNDEQSPVKRTGTGQSTPKLFI